LWRAALIECLDALSPIDREGGFFPGTVFDLQAGSQVNVETLVECTLGGTQADR
jgi:hypothetical protein